MSINDAPTMPYEWELTRLRNERLHLWSFKRVMSDHETTSKKCLAKSVSAKFCIDRVSYELDLARSVPELYNNTIKRLDKTCKTRCTPGIIRKANYFKNLV